MTTDVLITLDGNPLEELHQLWAPRIGKPEWDHSADGRGWLGAYEHATRTYAYATPDQPTLDRIVAFTGGHPIVEVGAGRGYWAKLLTDEGADVTAVDHRRPQDTNYFARQPGTYHPIIDGDATDAAELAGDSDATLLLIWPPWDTEMASKALAAYQRAGGRRVVYIGEGKYGCTGTDAFFDMLADQWHTDVHPVPNWHVGDRLWLCRRP